MTRQEFLRIAAASGLLLAAPVAAAPGWGDRIADGVVRVRSDYPFAETLARIKAALQANEIRFFGEIDQGALAGGAGVELGPSTLLLFGNPPLGLQLLTANPFAGLDWPVRMLVTEEKPGQVWVAWTDFVWLARRYGMRDREAVIAKATGVAAVIAGSAKRS
jgi:uncharacterized protein (DUF302 family)